MRRRLTEADRQEIIDSIKAELEYLKAEFIGVDPDWVYPSQIKVLRPGTTLLFYTDGLIETRGRSVDEGMDDLRRFVESLPDLAPQALCDRVLEWRLGAARREDDMCLLAARLS